MSREGVWFRSEQQRITLYPLSEHGEDERLKKYHRDARLLIHAPSGSLWLSIEDRPGHLLPAGEYHVKDSHYVLPQGFKLYPNVEWSPSLNYLERLEISTRNPQTGCYLYREIVPGAKLENTVLRKWESKGWATRLHVPRATPSIGFLQLIPWMVTRRD